MSIRNKLLSIKKQINLILKEGDPGDVGIQFAKDVNGMSIGGNNPFARLTKVAHKIIDFGDRVIGSVKSWFTWHMEAEQPVNEQTKSFLSKIISLMKSSLDSLRNILKDHNAAIVSLLIGFGIASIMVLVGYAVVYYIKNGSLFIVDKLKSIQESISGAFEEVKKQYNMLFDEKNGNVAKRVYKFVTAVIAAPFNYIYKVAEKGKDNYALEETAKAIFYVVGIGFTSIVYMYQGDKA